jgi:transcriptional regulator with XRE-family HTH domain
MKLRLSELREEKGVTRRVVSAATGITEATLGNYENKFTVPNLNTADVLADYFGCSVDYLMGRTEERKPIKQTV